MCLTVFSLDGFLTPIAKGHWQDLVIINFEHKKNHHLIVATYMYLLVKCSGHEIRVHVHGHKINVCMSVTVYLLLLVTLNIVCAVWPSAYHKMHLAQAMLSACLVPKK